MNNTPHLQQQQQQQHHHRSASPSSQLDPPRRSLPQATALSHQVQQHNDLTEAAEVPFPALVGYGVPPETVKQLIDMQAYLLQQVCTVPANTS